MFELDYDKVLEELTNLTKEPSEEKFSDVLEQYLVNIAETGDTIFPWSKVKPFIKKKMEAVLESFREKYPLNDSHVRVPNCSPFDYNGIKLNILQSLEWFYAAPFTIQRICELLTEPYKYYSRTDKFMRGIEKNIIVVTTIQPQPNKYSTPETYMIDKIPTFRDLYPQFATRSRSSSISSMINRNCPGGSSSPPPQNSLSPSSSCSSSSSSSCSSSASTSPSQNVSVQQQQSSLTNGFDTNHMTTQHHHQQHQQSHLHNNNGPFDGPYSLANLTNNNQNGNSNTNSGSSPPRTSAFYSEEGTITTTPSPSQPETVLNHHHYNSSSSSDVGSAPLQQLDSFTSVFVASSYLTNPMNDNNQHHSSPSSSSNTSNPAAIPSTNSPSSAGPWSQSTSPLPRHRLSVPDLLATSVGDENENIVVDDDYEQQQQQQLISPNEDKIQQDMLNLHPNRITEDNSDNEPLAAAESNDNNKDVDSDSGLNEEKTSDQSSTKKVVDNDDDSDESDSKLKTDEITSSSSTNNNGDEESTIVSEKEDCLKKRIKVEEKQLESVLENFDDEKPEQLREIGSEDSSSSSSGDLSVENDEPKKLLETNKKKLKLLPSNEQDESDNNKESELLTEHQERIIEHSEDQLVVQKNDNNPHDDLPMDMSNGGILSNLQPNNNREIQIEDEKMIIKDDDDADLDEEQQPMTVDSLANNDNEDQVMSEPMEQE